MGQLVIINACRGDHRLTRAGLKAVFITSDGVYAYNVTRDGIQEVELDDCDESRVEMIAQAIDETLESQLLACTEA